MTSDSNPTFMTSTNLERRAEIGREKRERTRQKLIAAAARVIAFRGDEHATIEDFIRAADLARGTFYNYFSTREELIDAVWAHIGKEPFLDIERLCAGIEDPAQRLIALARMVLERAASDEIWGWLIYCLSSDDHSLQEDLRAFPLPDLRDGSARGRFDIDDIEVARDLVVGIVRKALRVQLSGTANPDYDKIICTMMLRAVGLSRSEAEAVLSLPLPEAKQPCSVGSRLGISGNPTRP